MLLKIPASSANLGPGFDALGISLSIYLEIQIDFNSTNEMIITCEGYGADTVSKDPKVNLITSTAAHVAKCHGMALPGMNIHCINNIPLGSGLGSSGSAVVAGVCLANEACKLGLNMDRLVDWCFAIEGHPDNVAPSLLGGFIAAFLTENCSKDEIPVNGVGRYLRLPINQQIKAIVATPNFILPTEKARKSLPTQYSRQDVVFNLQRIAVLSNVLGTKEIDPLIVYEAMKDTVHQPYRQHLIPGLKEIFTKLHPAHFPGLLGVCISGAGPSVLALATHGFEEIGNEIQQIFSHKDDKGIECQVRVLDIDRNGVQIS